MLSVCQLKDMWNFLLHRGDAARIFALYDICQLFGQLWMEFLYQHAFPNDIDSNAGIYIA